ncbi:MAG: hypothetical protein ACREBH_01550 [Candidatus Micrarchaeaceae archaeon]
MADPANSAIERDGSLNRLYLAIISRYKDYIEEKEGLSVAELPTLVTPANHKVAEKVEEIKAGFLNYDYEANFIEASGKAFMFVKDEIADTVLPLQFWLTPEETLTFMLGDHMDKNILLCSMLVCLGNPSSKVLVRLNDGSRKVVTYCEFYGSMRMFDLEDAEREFKTKEEAVSYMGMDSDASIYEFNNQMYADIS